MTWFDLIKSSEMKEFEILAEKYADKGDMLHLDYLRKKHGKRSNEFYDALNDQIVKYLKEEDRWCSLQDISKSIQEQNPGLKDKEENLELTGYPNNNYEFNEHHCGGKIVKL